MKTGQKPGFVLIEVLIALAIFTFSILSLLECVGNSEQASGEAEKIGEATSLIRTKLAEIKLSLNEEIARGAFPDEKEEQGTFEEPYAEYRWSYTIRKVEIPLIQPTGEGSEVTLGKPTDPSKPQDPAAGFVDIAGAARSLAEQITKKISESIRELKLTVSWGESEEEIQKVVITTHLAKLK